MDKLKKIFKEKSDELKVEVKSLLKEHGGKKVDEVTLRQVFGGMRGVKSMVWTASNLDAEEGIRFRGYNIPQLREKLPTRSNDNEPLPEGLFWLMLTGELPEADDVRWLSDEWERRGAVPQHTYDLLDSLPDDAHPMAQLLSLIHI